MTVDTGSNPILKKLHHVPLPLDEDHQNPVTWPFLALEFSFNEIIS